MIAFFRDANWLDADRAQSYMRVLALGMAALVIWFGYCLHLQRALNPQHLLPANDFSAFWAGARLAVQGEPGAVYTPARTDAVVRAAAFMAQHSSVPYFYPPVFLLLTYPLGFFGYLPALIGFLTLSYLMVVLALWAGAREGWAVLPLVAMPAGVTNILCGQNGFISGTAFALAAVWLPRRPILAGAALGFLAFKPHLALMVPVALLAARQWRALAACAGSAAGLIALSAWCFGIDCWRAFIATAPVIGQVLQHHREDWGRQLSAFTAARLLGFDAGLAGMVQVLVVVATIAVLFWLCARRPGAQAQVALMAAAAVLGSPHLMDYDLVVLMPALSYVTMCGARSGFLPWEKIGLLIAYMLPLGARAANTEFAVPIALPVLAMCFALVARRVSLHGRGVMAKDLGRLFV